MGGWSVALPSATFDEVAVRMARSGADLVGYLNYIHPYRLQVLGEREIRYLNNSPLVIPSAALDASSRWNPPCWWWLMDKRHPHPLLKMCEEAQIPLFATTESSAFVIDLLRAYLSKHFADRTTLHGVFFDILGMGVFITGESGLGKSELGLELISRGHGLVADDAVDLVPHQPNHDRGALPRVAAKFVGSTRHWLARHSSDIW